MPTSAPHPLMTFSWEPTISTYKRRAILYILWYYCIKSYAYCRCPRHGPKNPWFWLCCNSLFGYFLDFGKWDRQVSNIGSGGFPCSRTLLCLQLFANTLKEQLVDCTREYKERYPCSLLKLGKMGTQGVHMKGVVPWLVLWARHAGTRYFCPALSA